MRAWVVAISIVVVLLVIRAVFQTIADRKEAKELDKLIERSKKAMKEREELWKEKGWK